MVAKLTRANLIALLKKNEERAALGLDPISADDFLASLPPEPVVIAAPAPAGDYPPGTVVDAKLLERNKELARKTVAQVQGPYRKKLFDALGVSAQISEGEKDAAAADAFALMATNVGVDLVQVTQQAGAQGLQGAQGKTGLFRAVQNEIGRAVKNVGSEVKRWTKAPIVGKYFVGPLGGNAIGETLVQVGAVLRGGSIRDFDDRAFVLALGQTFSASGQALIAASPWLPAPWNVAALAVGTCSVVVGKAMVGHVQQQEQKERIRSARGAQYQEPAQAVAQADYTGQSSATQSVEPDYSGEPQEAAYQPQEVEYGEGQE